MHEGLLFTLPEPHLRAVVLEHSTLFPTWHPVTKTFHLCCVDSDTIRNREMLPEEETQNAGIFVFERKKLCANLKADETGLLKYFNRMSSSDFDFLLNKIEDKVSRVDTNYCNSIPASV